MQSILLLECFYMLSMVFLFPFNFCHYGMFAREEDFLSGWGGGEGGIWVFKAKEIGGVGGSKGWTDGREERECLVRKTQMLGFYVSGAHTPIKTIISMS